MGRKLPFDVGIEKLEHSDEHRDEVSQKRICRVVRSLHAHCSSFEKMFKSFDLVEFVDKFSALLSANELVYFEVLLSILGGCCFSIIITNLLNSTFHISIYRSFNFSLICFQ